MRCGYAYVGETVIELILQEILNFPHGECIGSGKQYRTHVESGFT